jgi:uncharacterized repeat protein (TIGR03843 family)
MTIDPVLEVKGQISEASNATFFCHDPRTGIHYVYKPVLGERPLWDFPDSSLTGREIAASEIDKLTGWGLVPPTQWVCDGPHGQGMIQEWVSEIDPDRPVNLFAPDSVPPTWISVVSGIDHTGQPVVLAHADVPQLQKLALFDAIVNNADRKAGHILATGPDQFYAIDHGVCFHEENKLRTVVWGWAGSPVPSDLLPNVEKCLADLGTYYEPVDTWLSESESSALRRRIERLLDTQIYPLPSPDWPAIPWPVF